VAVLSTEEADVILRNNYLMTKSYLKYIDDVFQLSHASLDRYWFYIHHLLLWSDDKPFSKIVSIRPTFQLFLSSLDSPRSEHGLAPTTRKKILGTTKRFLRWAKTTHPREFRKLPLYWIDSLRLPRQADITKERSFVSLAEVEHLASLPIPEDNLAQVRERAATAMLYSSGMRPGAFATMPIEAVNLNELSIKQWPELGVKTKNGKRATTFIFAIPLLIKAVDAWDSIVRKTLPPDAPWYAPIDHAWGEHWLSTKLPGKNRSQALNRRLRLLFSAADLPYKSAHKFRHGHAVYGLQHARTMADYKAVSMNMMHANIKITDQIYAPLLNSEVQQRIAGLLGQPTTQPDDELQTYFRCLSDAELSIAIQIAAERMSR